MSDYNMAKGAATSFKFNSFEEIKSHSSILYNERLAILWYLIDMHSIRMNAEKSINEILETHAILKQIYSNIRMLLRFNPTCRATLNLETKDDGIYVTDVAMGVIDRMIEHCETNDWTARKIYILIGEINRVQMLLKDVMQYFSYFIRPDFRQKPDLEIATEVYKQMADQRTVDELRALVGKHMKVDFDGLGSSRVELNREMDTNAEDEYEGKDLIEYDEELDGEKQDGEKQDDESTTDGPSTV